MMSTSSYFSEFFDELPGTWNTANHWKLSIDWFSLNGPCVRNFLRQIQRLIEMIEIGQEKYFKTFRRVL